jgi:hypothetical protein
MQLTKNERKGGIYVILFLKLHVVLDYSMLHFDSILPFT